MTFVTAGLAVAGVASIAIPLLIFLLWRQRRTPVDWAAMRFLLEAFRKHRRRLQLEQLLLLAIRCLIPLVLGLALARPVLEAVGIIDAGGGRIVYLVVDDGLCSQARNTEDETALAGHVDRAVEIIESLDVGDRIGVITAARPSRALIDPPSSDHASIIELLRDLEPHPAPSDLAGAIDTLGRITGRLESDHEQVFAYLLSDFRSGSAALDETLAPSLQNVQDRVVLLASPPASEPIPNVQITSVEPARSVVLAGASDGSGQVTVRLDRQGGELGHAISQVRLGGEGVAALEPRTVQWAPGQSEASVEFMLDFDGPRERESGITASLERDAVPGDNERHVVLELRRRVRLVLLDRRSFGFEPTVDQLSSGQWMRRALAPVDGGSMEIIAVEPAALDRADLVTADVVMLPRPDLVADAGWTMLRRFVDLGGLLIISPPDEMVVHRWTDHIRTSLGLPWQIEREVREHDDGLAMAGEQPRSQLLQMISGDLVELMQPVIVWRRLPVDVAGTQADPVLLFEDGSPMLLAGRPRQSSGETSDAPSGATAAPTVTSRGLVTYLAVAPQLDWTTLPGKPLMVPLWHEMVRQGLSQIRSGQPVGVGARPALPVGPSAGAVLAPEGERLAVDAAGRPDRSLPAPGLYSVVDRANQPIGTVAVNVDAASGRTDPHPPAAVKSWLNRSGAWDYFDTNDVVAPLRRAQGGSPIAGILLFVLLGLIVLETVLARWFSHADAAKAGTRGGALRPSMDVRLGGAA